MEACERFLFLEVLAEAAGTTEQLDQNPPRPIQSVLTKALNKVASDDENWTSLSELGNHLNRTDPSFDARNYGFSKLSDLVAHQPFVETKTLQNTSGRRSLWVRLRGRRPADADPARPTAPSAHEKTAAKKTTARKTAAKKTAAEKTAAEKTAAEKTAAEKTAAEKTAAEKTAAEKTAAEKTAAEKTAAEKSTAKKTTRKAATKTAGVDGAG